MNNTLKLKTFRDGEQKVYNGIAIESSIDIPESRSGRKGSPPKYPFHLMEVGDSFFMPGQKNVPAAYQYAKKHKGVKFASRRWKENAQTGVRIWRVA